MQLDKLQHLSFPSSCSYVHDMKLIFQTLHVSVGSSTSKSGKRRARVTLLLGFEKKNRTLKVNEEKYRKLHEDH